MPATSRTGPLTEWAKSAGLLGSAVRSTAHAAGTGVAALGRGVWGAAGHLAPNPVLRAGLLGTAAVGVGTQAPQLAGRISQDARYVRGEGPTVRGF